MPEPLDRFLGLHDELWEKFPKYIEEARRCAESTVDRKTEFPEKMWSVLWNRPLFASVHAAIGKEWMKRIGDEIPGACRRPETAKAATAQFVHVPFG